MKKLTFLLISILFTLNAFSQKRIEDFNKGIPITIGGVALTIGCVFTPTEFERQQGTYGWQESPIWKQDARLIGIVTGGCITTTGLITTLLDKKSRKKWR